MQNLFWLLLVMQMSAASKPVSSNYSRPAENMEKVLLDYITREYDRNVRPIYNASKAIVIELGITLTQIFDMDEKNQVLTTNVWLDQEWFDEMLVWEPEDFGGLKVIRIPCEKLWLPDIVLYNNADDYTSGYMHSKAMVHSNGKVFWPPPTKFRSTCAVDVTYFPFDDQTCTMKLGSWTYNGFEVDVVNRSEDVDLSNYVDSGEWELLLATVHRNVVFYSCCSEPFPDVTISLTMRRKTLFYMYNIVLPCMMMSSLTLLVFCMPTESGEKVALGVTVLLAFSVFMLAIAEKMPETSDNIPLIGIYLTSVMAITSVSIIMTVVVLNLHYHSAETAEEGARAPSATDASRMPVCIKKLLFNRSAAMEQRPSTQQCQLPASSAELELTHLACAPPDRNSHADPSEANTSAKCVRHSSSARHCIEENITRGRTAKRPVVSRERSVDVSEQISASTLYCHEPGSCHTDSEHSNTNSVRETVCFHCGSAALGSTSYHTRYQHSRKTGPAYLTRPLMCSHAYCHCLRCQPKPCCVNESGRSPHDTQLPCRSCAPSQSQSEGHPNQWRRLAVTCDRVLFWVFLVVTLVISLLFIVILPKYKRSQMPSGGTLLKSTQQQ